MKLTFRLGLVILITIMELSCARYSPHPGKPRGYKGEWDKYYEWKSSDKKIYPTEIQRKALIDSFNRIPENIGVIDVALDTAVMASHCYKFIYSPDSTKFISFYVFPYESEERKFITRNGSSTIHHGGYQKKEGQAEYYGITAWGIKYNGRWYYDRESGHSFIGNNLKSAQADFLFYTLDDIWFFEKWLTPNHSFWQIGGKSVVYLPLRIENYLSIFPAYEGYPVLVALGSPTLIMHNSRKCKRWVRQNTDLIRKTDSIKLDKIYLDHLDSYGDIFKKDASELIVSIIASDTADNFKLYFLYFQLQNDSIVAINKLNKDIATDSSRKFQAYWPSKKKFYEQFLPEFNHSTQVTKDDEFWKISVKEMIGQSLLSKQ